MTYLASLVSQWLGVRLPVQSHRFHPWPRRIPHDVGQPSPSIPGLLRPRTLESVLCNEGSHHNEPTPRNRVWSPLTAARESPHVAMKTQRSQNQKDARFYWLSPSLLQLQYSFAVFLKIFPNVSYCHWQQLGCNWRFSY